MYKIQNNIQLEKNFSLKEFLCKCGECNAIVRQDAIKKLQELRNAIKMPIEVVSAYRCHDYNKRVGGAKASKHMQGIAFDIKVKGMTPTEVALIAKSLGFTGIGIYPTFTHVDIRSGKSYWKEDKGKLESINDIREE